MDKTKIYNYINILGVIGVLLACYLYYNFVFQPENPVCSISDTVNCDAVTKGELSRFFSIPVPLIGLTGYLFILLFSIFEKPKMVLGVALFGMLFCLRLTILEVFVLKVYCPVCLTCQVVMLLITILAFKLNSKKTIYE